MKKVLYYNIAIVMLMLPSQRPCDDVLDKQSVDMLLTRQVVFSDINVVKKPM
jgi:hypothetical protein